MRPPPPTGRPGWHRLRPGPPGWPRWSPIRFARRTSPTAIGSGSSACFWGSSSVACCSSGANSVRRCCRRSRQCSSWPGCHDWCRPCASGPAASRGPLVVMVARLSGCRSRSGSSPPWFGCHGGRRARWSPTSAASCSAPSSPPPTSPHLCCGNSASPTTPSCSCLARASWRRRCSCPRLADWRRGLGRCGCSGWRASRSCRWPSSGCLQDTSPTWPACRLWREPAGRPTNLPSCCSFSRP